MANLVFPQLSTGAMTQYPFKKQRSVRTVQNVMADGSVISYPDPASALILWDLNLNNLLPSDRQALQSFFASCFGPLSAFTFIDPADNMLAFSADLTSSAWIGSSDLQIASSTIDPFGGTSAFTVSNAGQTPAVLSQSMPVPANYQYCFSVYVKSPVRESALQLLRTGSNMNTSTVVACPTAWTRVISAGRLNDGSSEFTIGVQLQPGQTISLFGPQVEPQIEPSAYRATHSRNGIYQNAHWHSNQLWFSADGPSSFATSFSIESAL